MIPLIINITQARQVGDYSIVLDFDDGKQQLVNFKPFLIKSHHPDIRHWLDLDKFSTFRIEYGELVWGDYELCFPICDLYFNELEHNHALEAFG
jgi:hypothetical protein